MPSVGTASADLVFDRDQVGRSLHAAVDGAAPGLRNKFTGLGKMLIGGLGAAFAGFQGFKFLGDTLGEAREAAEVGRDTEAVLKSTGAVAGVTAKGVGALADRLSAMAGVDDELIAKGENVLLTFTKVRNEVGKGNNIFDRATAAALDLSARMGTDLQGSIVQVGKALNDPVKGVTALTRAGVSFTKQQKEQIKALVESGRTLDAQKLILRNVETQFGGAAAAAADPAKKLGVAWANLKEQLGTALLPTMNRVSTFLTTSFVPALSEAGSLLGRAFSHPDEKADVEGWRAAVVGIGRALRAFVDDAKGAISDFIAGFRGDDVKTTAGQLGDTFHTLSEFVKNEVVPALGAAAAFLRDTLAPVLSRVAGFLGDNLTAVVAAYGTFKAISLGSSIVETVSGAYNTLAVALGRTAAEGYAAAGGLGAANTQAASSGGFMAGATAGTWALAGALGVGLGVVLHNFIEDHFPGFNRGLERFGAWVYDHGIAPVGRWITALRGAATELDLLQRKAAQGLGGNFTPNSGGKGGGGGGIGARAAGGPLGAGELSWVGERGPELFRPDVSGTIIPNHQVAAAVAVSRDAPAVTVPATFLVDLTTIAEIDGERFFEKTVRHNVKALRAHDRALQGGYPGLSG